MTTQLNGTDKSLQNKALFTHRLFSGNNFFPLKKPKKYMFAYTAVRVPFSGKLLRLWTTFQTGVEKMPNRIFISIEEAEAKKKEWKKLRGLCGGIRELSKFFNVPQRTVEDWIYYPYQDIPYEYVVLAWCKFGVSIEALAPDKSRTNKALLTNCHKNTRTVLFKDIVPNNLFYREEIKKDGIIIIDKNNVIISGHSLKDYYESIGYKGILVFVLNTADKLLLKKEIEDLSLKLNFDEKVAISIYLESKLGERKGRRSINNENYSKNDKKNDLIRRNSDEFTRFRTDVLIADLFGWKKDYYRQAKHVYLNAVPSLLKLVNQNRVSINRAALVVDACFHEDCEQLETMLDNLLIGKIDGSLLQKIKEEAKQKGSKSPRFTIIHENFENEHQEQEPNYVFTS